MNYEDMRAAQAIGTGIGSLASVAGIGQEVKRPGISREMEDLDTQISKLGAAVSELRMRIDPVLLPSYPTPETNSKEPKPPQGSGLGDVLATYRYRLREILASVSEMHGRLDL